MSDTRTKALLGAGLAAGFSIGILFYLFERYFRKKDEEALNVNVQYLKRVVFDLTEEITKLKKTRKKSFSGDVQDFASAIDSDECDEFFDLTSDEESIDYDVKSELGHNTLHHIDKLQEGSPEDQNTAFAMLTAMLSESSSNAEVLWRLSKAYYFKSNECSEGGDNSERKRFLELGLSYGEKAIAADPTSAESHKWFAILTGLYGDFLPTKDKIKNGFIFQQHVDEAIKQKPDDFSLHHLLARFKYEVAGLSWMERKIATALFGEPPSATYQEAFADCLKAELLNKNPWAENKLLAAKCAFGSANYEQGFAWLEKTESILEDTPPDKKLRQEIEQLTKKYSKYAK